MLSILIVNWSGMHYMQACLLFIQAHMTGSYKVVVVDGHAALKSRLADTNRTPHVGNRFRAEEKRDPVAKHQRARRRKFIPGRIRNWNASCPSRTPGTPKPWVTPKTVLASLPW